jgi:hypothetical protein
MLHAAERLAENRRMRERPAGLELLLSGLLGFGAGVSDQVHDHFQCLE